MNIRFATVADKEQWNDFIRAQSMGSFLLSWEWGDFLAGLPRRVWRLVVENESEWLGVLFLMSTSVSLGLKTLESPRGLALKNGLNSEDQEKALELLLKKVDTLAREEKAVQFQLDPLSSDFNLCNIFKKFGLRKVQINSQPRHTLLLDLTKSEDELLNGLSQKTRYNLRLAQKKGVKVSLDNTRLEEFYALFQKTGQRQKIRLFSRAYFEKLLQLPFVKLYLAQVNGQYVAASIVVSWNNTATYLFGGSDYKYRAVMASYLLQWQAIQDAKAQGCVVYDFWGVAPQDAAGRERNWQGITRFKQGFAPETPMTEYLGAYEKVFRPFQLKFYRFVRRLRR